MNYQLSNFFDYSCDQNDTKNQSWHRGKWLRLQANQPVQMKWCTHSQWWTPRWLLRQVYFHNRGGMTCIDYLLTRGDMFKLIKEFIVCNVNKLSDHAPLITPSNTYIRTAVRKTWTRCLKWNFMCTTPMWNSVKIHEGCLALKRNLLKITSLFLRHSRKSWLIC